MASYKYLMLISSGGSGLTVSSTDQEVVEELLAELRKFTPFQMDEIDKLPSGETYRWHLYELERTEMSVRWWLFKQLCLQGWEPLGEGKFKFKDERS